MLIKLRNSKTFIIWTKEIIFKLKSKGYVNGINGVVLGVITCIVSKKLQMRF
jgi:hypothetical protein